MSDESLLSRLASRAELVPETAELVIIKRYKARHVNLGASKITAAAQLDEHDAIVNAAIGWAQKKVGKGGNRKLVAIRSVERLSVEFARTLKDMVQGDISVEVDGRLAYKRRAMIDRSRQLMDQLEEAGVPKGRRRPRRKVSREPKSASSLVARSPFSSLRTAVLRGPVLRGQKLSGSSFHCC